MMYEHGALNLVHLSVTDELLRPLSRKVCTNVHGINDLIGATRGI